VPRRKQSKRGALVCNALHLGRHPQGAVSLVALSPTNTQKLQLAQPANQPINQPTNQPTNQPFNQPKQPILTHPVERAETNVVAPDQKAVVARVDQHKGKLAAQPADAVWAILEVERQNDLAVAASLPGKQHNHEP